MNKQNFSQLGGFPFETDILDWMQTAYTIFNSLGAAVGNYGIISGCTITGSNVSDGVVYIDGEIYKFVGGLIQTNVRIIESITTKVFENGDTNPVHYERYVTFASGTGSIPWSNFKKPETLLQLSSRILPAGTNPQLYSGSVSNIPAGWNLCDGGTYNSIVVPDLRSRFIVGYDSSDPDYNAIGKIGGAKQVILTEAQMPKHKHTMTFAELPTGNTANPGYDGGNNNYSQNASKDTNEKGNDQPHENRPPYYTLAYIIYTG